MKQYIISEDGVNAVNGKHFDTEGEAIRYAAEYYKLDQLFNDGISYVVNTDKGVVKFRILVKNAN